MSSNDRSRPSLTMFLCLLTGCTEVMMSSDDDDDVIDLDGDADVVDLGWDDDSEVTRPSTPVNHIVPKSPLAQSVMLAQSSLLV